MRVLRGVSFFVLVAFALVGWSRGFYVEAPALTPALEFGYQCAALLGYFLLTITAISDIQRRERHAFVAATIIASERETVSKRNIEIEAMSQQLSQTQLELGVLSGVEQERERIARDLHDSLGQMLAIAKLNVSDALERNDALASNLPFPLASNFLSSFAHDLARPLERSLRALNTAIDETRAIARDLSPVGLHEIGLGAALRELFARVPQDVAVKFMEDVQYRFTEAETIALYRMVQEILQNALKYSSCTEFVVDILQYETSVVLTAEDNGTGFELAEVAAKRGTDRGMGLQNLQTRARQIGAELSIDAARGRGTIITITLPVHQ
jgi:two-component system, NarL family, sensor kinase